MLLQRPTVTGLETPAACNGKATNAARPIKGDTFWNARIVMGRFILNALVWATGPE